MTNGIPFVHQQASLFDDQERGRRFPDERHGDGEDRGMADAIRGRLLDEPALEAGHIEVLVRNGEITLRGTVPSYGDSHRAEALAGRVSDGAPVHNELRIQHSLF